MAVKGIKKTENAKIHQSFIKIKVPESWIVSIFTRKTQANSYFFYVTFFISCSVKECSVSNLILQTSPECFSLPVGLLLNSLGMYTYTHIINIMMASLQ